MATIKNRYTYKSGKGNESGFGPSVTIPDQHFRLADLLKKHHVDPFTLEQIAMQDANFIFQKGEEDFDSPDYEKAQNMDIADRHEIAAYAKSKNEELEKQYNKEQAQIKQHNQKLFYQKNGGVAEPSAKAALPE